MLASPLSPQPPQPPPATAELELHRAVEAAESSFREARSQIRPVEVRFPAGSLSGYDPGGVELAAAATKRELLDHLGSEDLAALRAWIEGKYPDPGDSLKVISLRGEKLATKDSTDAVFDWITGLLARLKRIESLEIRLKLAVTPGEARVELWPAALPADKHKKIYRADDAPTVYLGLYQYRVAKDGYWDIGGDLDLVETEGDTLECRLSPRTGPDAHLPCSLK